MAVTDSELATGPEAAATGGTRTGALARRPGDDRGKPTVREAARERRRGWVAKGRGTDPHRVVLGTGRGAVPRRVRAARVWRIAHRPAVVALDK